MAAQFRTVGVDKQPYLPLDPLLHPLHYTVAVAHCLREEWQGGPAPCEPIRLPFISVCNLNRLD